MSTSRITRRVTDEFVARLSPFEDLLRAQSPDGGEVRTPWRWYETVVPSKDPGEGGGMPGSSRLRLCESAEFECPYLPGRIARFEGLEVDSVPGRLYGRLLDLNFRRSSRQLYRPACPTCRACRQLRIPVADFAPTGSQRRVSRRNQDIAMELGPPNVDDERLELYRAYLDGRHDSTMARTREAFVEFLYESGVDPLEATYRQDGRLVAVSILDVVPSGWSSVYSFFDPREAKRSLGTLTVLREVGVAREAGVEWYYLGYHVSGARTMDYKARFLPHQKLRSDHTWESFAHAERTSTVPAEVVRG